MNLSLIGRVSLKLHQGVKSAWIKNRFMFVVLVISVISESYLQVAHCAPMKLRHKHKGSFQDAYQLAIQSYMLKSKTENLQNLYFHHGKLEDKKFYDKLRHILIPQPPKKINKHDQNTLFKVKCDIGKFLKYLNLTRKQEQEIHGDASNSLHLDYKKIIDGDNKLNHHFERLDYWLGELVSQDSQCETSIPDDLRALRADHLRYHRDYIILNHAKDYLQYMTKMACYYMQCKRGDNELPPECDI